MLLMVTQARPPLCTLCTFRKEATEQKQIGIGGCQCAANLVKLEGIVNTQHHLYQRHTRTEVALLYMSHLWSLLLFTRTRARAAIASYAELFFFILLQEAFGGLC